jgi:hypothetical protein
MDKRNNIKLYGAGNCHKTQYYKKLLTTSGVVFSFYDVTANKSKELELRGLYASGKANIPTFVIGHKKLRNPKDKELQKWLNKAEAANYKDPNAPVHNSETFKFTCGIEKAAWDVSDAIEY